MEDRPVVLERHPLHTAVNGTAAGGDAPLRTLAARQAVGGGLVIAGLLAVLAGWWGVAGTPETWKQFSYLASGGVGGAALVAVGVAVLISYEHARDREAIADMLDRIAPFEEIAHRLSAFDPAELSSRLSAIEASLSARNGQARPRSRR